MQTLPTATTNFPVSSDLFIKDCLRAVHYLKVTTTVFILAQKVKKKVKGLFQQIIIHLARLLSEPVAGKPPDHQDDPERDRPHWWQEIKSFVTQIQAEHLSEAQLRKILEDAFSPEDVDAVIEALKQASEIMGDPPLNLFQ